MSTDPFELRAVTNEPGEMALVKALLKSVFPESHVWRTDFLHWLYFDNPHGHVIGLNAWDGPNLAAHYVVTPIRALHYGRAVDAVLSLNTATDPRYQRRGLFTRLAAATYEVCRERGFHHVIGVGNAKSTPGLHGRLQTQPVGPLDVYLGLGMPTLLARERGPHEVSWKRVWTQETLAWRLRMPGGRFMLARSGEAVCPMAHTGIMGIHCVLKMETEPALAGVITRTLKPGLALSPRLWMGFMRGRVKPALASAEVPEALRKSPLNMIFLPLQDEHDRVDADAMEFEAIDFDAY